MTSSEMGVTSSEMGGRAWRTGGALPPDFVAERVVATPDGGGWIFGQRGGGTTGVIASVHTGGAVTIAWEGSGWVRSGDWYGAGFAVRGEFVGGSPRFSLLRGRDGKAWEDVGVIPASSVTHVVAVGPEEAWVLGAQGIVRWAGAFQQIPSPGERDSTRDRLFRVGATVALAAPDGLWLAREDGQRWGHRDIDGAHVRAVSSPYVAALRGETIHVGRLTRAWVDWIGHIEGNPADPLELAWEDGAVQLSAVPRDPERDPGVLLFDSRPEGGFGTSLVRVPGPSWLGIAGARGALAVTLQRRILQAGP